MPLLVPEQTLQFVKICSLLQCLFSVLPLQCLALGCIGSKKGAMRTGSARAQQGHSKGPQIYGVCTQGTPETCTTETQISSNDGRIVAIGSNRCTERHMTPGCVLDKDSMTQASHPKLPLNKTIPILKNIKHHQHHRTSSNTPSFLFPRW